MDFHILRLDEVFLLKIDMTLDAGLGLYIQKNELIFQDTLNWGFGACRHSNGKIGG
jgi:hypothetical protein